MIPKPTTYRRKPAILMTNRILCAAGLILAIVSASCVAAFSQKRYNVWAFGANGGLNFNTSPPTGFKSKAVIEDDPVYYSSICDTNGNLMFYTDGITVWNRNGFKMPKYNNWWPLAGKVMPLVCPRPGSDTLFYLFAVSDAANPYELQALPLKLRKAGDIDEMIYPRPTGPNNFQKRLKTNCSMAVAGTGHCNRRDYWITTYADHALYSFLVTDTGINTIPVVTPVPSSIIYDSTIQPGYSNLKFAANGEKLMIPDLGANQVVVYDFDNATGSFSNPVKLGAIAGYQLEEAELSPDGTKLYVGIKRSENDGRPITYHEVAQYDLSLGSIPAIEGSHTIVTPIADMETCNRATCFFVYRAMNVGPDGRLYVGMRYATRKTIPIDETFSVIEAPNSPGLNCLYKKAALSIRVKYLFAGYNYLRSESYPLRENGIAVQKENCLDKPVRFDILFKKVDSVRWDFGDPASGAANYSTSFSVEHSYPSAGAYKVSAIIYTKCQADTAVVDLAITEDLVVTVPETIKDTTICEGEPLVLNARNGSSNAYTWENGLILPDRTITEAGNYRVMIMNDCSISMREFKVQVKNCPCNVYVPTAFTPNNDGLNDLFKPAVQCFVRNYRLVVFNRYGQQVFSTTDPTKGWDGFVGPYRQQTGTFVWMLEYTNPGTRQVNSRKGTVVLLR